MNINEEFQIHEQLNPKVWDSAGQLRPEVRKAIIEVVKEFEKNIQAPLDIVDIQICGSNASFNYVDSIDYKSDLDVHIIANFEMVSQEVELVKLIYDLEKTAFNKNHTITIHGINIELYIQDINSTVVSNGIYSVLDNKWVKEPKPLKTASKKNIDKEMEAWRQHIAKVIQSQNEKEILNSINTIYLIRHNALAAEGEFSKGNQLVKEIRAEGLLDRLKDEYHKLVDQRLTVEHLAESGYSNGQLIQRLDEGFNYNCSCDVILPNDRSEHFEGMYYANSKEKAINQMTHFVHEKYGYKVYIRNIKAEL